jgi:DUF1707 SHOCT-like domain
MSAYRWMRASDDDREQAAALLGDAFAAGRLTRDELNERCGAVYTAQTWGELEVLTADLPVVPAKFNPLTGPVAPGGGQRPDQQKPFWLLLRLALILGATLAAVTVPVLAWTGVPLILLALLPPGTLRAASQRRRR